jgi:tetratricopeptide (TPR) repeat protein
MISASHSLQFHAGDRPGDFRSLTQAAGSLISIGTEIFLKGDHEDQAMAIFDAAHSIITAPSASTVHNLWTVVAKNLQVGSTVLSSSSSKAQPSSFSVLSPPDLYQEDECDVGPRILKTPIAADFYTTQNMVLLEAIILFNKGLIYHSKGCLSEAKQLYEVVSFTVQNMLCFTMGAPSSAFMELAMRTHNNLGLISYLERNEGVAAASFETSIHFAKHLAELTKAHRLEYATALSNWCRVIWMRGDISDTLHKALKEVLRIRVSILSWDHPDVAAARYNVAVAEYTRQSPSKAVSHLLQYLAISAHRSKNQKLDDLDAIPALIFLLLIQNEEKDDNMSQELVRGLRTLQDKRQDEGPNSPDLASVLNFVGTVLFHQKDFENALLFFREELRLEDKSDECTKLDETTSVSVTCNNIGRILQELGRFQEAIYYYERALKAEYGDISESPSIKATSLQAVASSIKSGAAVSDASENPFSSVNLYSTVWYNLGLIHDKLGSYDDAINAFEMSLKLRQAMLGTDHPDVACLLYNIGVLQMEQQRLHDAMASFRKALRIRSVGETGQLNDRHIIKTLERLVSLHETKGDITSALEASKQVLSIQEMSSEFDEVSRTRDMGVTLRSIADLFQAINDLSSAVHAASGSVNKLRAAAEMEAQQHQQCVNSDMGDLLLLERIANVEQLVSSLLLLGSLHHEMCEPLQAEIVLREAATIVKHAITAADECHASSRPSSLYALQEVTCMLATCHCAPEA